MKPLAPGLGSGVLVVALVQGILGDVLLRTNPWGLNLAAWAATGIAGIAIVAYRESIPVPRACWAWLAAAASCGLLVAGRGAAALTVLTVQAGMGCLILAAWSARGGNPFRAGILAAAIEAITTGLHAIAGALPWVFSSPTVPGASRPVPPVLPHPGRRRWARMAVGSLAAIPVLVLFGTLFAAADPIFAQGLRALVGLDINLDAAAAHVLAIGAWGWVAAGYGRRLVGGPAGDGAARWIPAPPQRAPGIEVLTGLGLVAILFLAFVAVQVRYLFGDDSLVQSLAGMTYSEYARRGFYELLAVALLLLPLLLFADWLLGGVPDRRGFQFLAGLLLGLLGVVLISGWKRLGLYTSAYGLTEPRLYAAAVLAWVALLAIGLAAVVLPGHRPRFLAVVALSGLAVLAGLHVLNPDAFIARHNLARARAGNEVDIEHLVHLGPDAAPVLIRELSSLAPTHQIRLQSALRERWGGPESDWRAWNLARVRARAAVAGILDSAILREAPSAAPPGAAREHQRQTPPSP